MKDEVSPTISNLVLSSFLTIFSFAISVEARFLQQTCASSCGDVNITYPFRLSTDPLACGDSDYELSCQDNAPILEFHSGKYLVKRISYDSNIIRLVDFNLANGSCGLPYNSLSVDDLRSDSRYRGLVSSTFSSFFRCSNEIKDQSYREVPCLSQNASHFYVTYSNYIISDLHGSCSFVSRVPTIYQAVLYPSYDSILQLMASGFDLEWSIECRNCIADGGSCYLSSVGTPNVYKCHFSRGIEIHLPPIVSFIFAAIWDIALVVNLVARFILAPIVIIGFLIHKYRTTKKTEANNEICLSNQQPSILKRCSYSDVIEITNNFKEKLGRGGFGTVFKGQLADGYVVAVKMLGESNFSNEDFINEISVFGKIHHVNVAKLVGFCCEESHHALVFEHVANGSLDEYMFSRGEIPALSWAKLLQISIGTARGIEHLHVGCDVCILHLDIKPHNVLLDSNFVPKLSDFGLAKFYPKEYDFVSASTRRGTMGYVAPALISNNLRSASSKSDVYSFGMLLLEMARARMRIDAETNNLDKAYFASWVYAQLNERGELELGNASETEVGIGKKLCIIGLWCIQKNASDRPLMTKVVEMLEGNVNALQLPPSPMSFPHYIPTEDPQSDSLTELLISETVEKSQ